MYKSQFERAVNPTNLAMFINSYIHRTDLHIARTPSGTPQQSKTLKMPVMNITGSLSPHSDDTVTFNGRLDPTNSSWMKVTYVRINTHSCGSRDAISYYAAYFFMLQFIRIFFHYFTRQYFANNSIIDFRLRHGS